MTPPTDPAVPADPPRPEVGKPPFQDLVKPGTEPGAVPHFGPLEAPDEEADRKPTLADRWRALPPRRQKQVLGAGIVVIAAAVFLWPTPSDARAPRPDPRPEVTTVIKEVPVADAAPAVPITRYRMTAAKVPLNTRVTKENVATLFVAHDANSAPAGTVFARDQIVGKYVVAELNAGQLLNQAELADQPLPPPPAADPAPRPIDQRSVRVLTRSGVRVAHYELWPDTGWRQVREEFTPATAEAAKTGGLQ